MGATAHLTRVDHSQLLPSDVKMHCWSVLPAHCHCPGVESHAEPVEADVDEDENDESDPLPLPLEEPEDGEGEAVAVGPKSLVDDEDEDPLFPTLVTISTSFDPPLPFFALLPPPRDRLTDTEGETQLDEDDQLCLFVLEGETSFVVLFAEVEGEPDPEPEPELEPETGFPEGYSQIWLSVTVQVKPLTRPTAQLLDPTTSAKAVELKSTPPSLLQAAHPSQTINPPMLLPLKVAMSSLPQYLARLPDMVFEAMATTISEPRSASVLNPESGSHIA